MLLEADAVCYLTIHLSAGLGETVWFNILAIIGFVVLGFLISGGEQALFSITPGELNQLEQTHKRIFAMVGNLLARPRHLLVLIKTLQMAFNVSILFFAARIGVYLFEAMPMAWLWYLLEIIVLITLLIIFEEVLPRYFAGRNTLLWARRLAPPLYWFGRMLYPFTQFIISSAQMIEHRFARSNHDNGLGWLERPEGQLAEQATDEHDRPLLPGLLRFRSKVVRQIMKPRIDIVWVDENDSLEQVLHVAEESNFSRLPVFRGGIDGQVRGILYTKDLLGMLTKAPQQPWQKLIRPAYLVPEGNKIDQLLAALQNQRIHMAIVVDEYGRVVGIVTLEDVVEEIVGEIRDETDEHLEVDYVQLDNLNYEFEGKTTLSDFCQIMQLPDNFFEESLAQAETLGGLLLELFGSIPKSGDVVEHRGLVFTVLVMENYRIQRVRVTKIIADERS